MFQQVPADLLMIYGLGIVACALILWIGRLPADEIDDIATKAPEGR